MQCPSCHYENPFEIEDCAKCGAKLERDDRTITTFSAQSQGSPRESHSIRGLPSGTVIAQRYEIVKLLGEGGMGAVYKATDRELDRTIALKVIRPELAGNPEVLQRFKQELILARKITHRNVIRIFDLGVTDDLKFITMEFVEGRDLHSILKERRLTPEESVNIIRQVCEALVVAHAEKVIHRDLKPHNIMLDANGRVCVMDFGLARSLEMPGLTQTGAFMGTPAYMSPEQAKGLPAGARSDIFTVGIILYELLTGEVPFNADTVLASLLKRTQGPPPAPVRVNSSIPKSLSEITLKSLAVDPEHRYQSVQEMVADLDGYQGVRRGATLIAHRRMVTPRLRMLEDVAGRKWISLSVAAMLLILGAIYGYARLFWKPALPPTAMSVLVADINNTTADPVFNGTLEPALTVALEGATFISAYNRGEARRVASQLQPGATRLDESLAKLVAVRQGIGVVVAGSISQEGSGYRLAVRAVDAFTGKVIGSEQLDGINKEGMLMGTAKLAARLRRALRDDTPESLQLAAAETFSASSVEAAHSYALAEQAEWSGKHQEAISYYSKSVDLDPNLGRAYANMAAVYANLGKMDEAEKNQRLAMARIDRMSDRERYKTRGIYYLVKRNDSKAIEELSTLVKQYPGDGAGLQNLALAYFYHRDFPKALEIGRRASLLSPKNVSRLNNVALYAMYAGDFQTSVKDAQAVLALNPSFAKAYLAIALSSLAENQVSKAEEAYRKMAALSLQGASLAAIGLADLAMYEGRIEDAVAILDKQIAVDIGNNSVTPAAMKSAVLAQAYAIRANRPLAQTAADRALQLSSSDSVQIIGGRAYSQAGLPAKAAPILKELRSRLNPDSQVYATLIEGEMELERGNARQAVKLFDEAQKIADTWLGRFDLGRAYVALKAYTEAHSELEACLKRRGEVTALLLDDLPSYRFFPDVYYYLGRAQEGLQSGGAAESYKTFLAIRGKGFADRLVLDARRRLAGH